MYKAKKWDIFLKTCIILEKSKQLGAQKKERVKTVSLPKSSLSHENGEVPMIRH